MKILDSSNNEVLHVKNNALQCEGLEKFIIQLNKLGGLLYQDVKTGKIFRIEEIENDKEIL